MAYNQELAERMRRILGTEHAIVEKRMFGGIGFMANGNLACGIHKQELIARLGEDDFKSALKKQHVRIFDMAGRPMKGWVMVAAEGCASESQLRGWIAKSLAHARSLPPT